MDSKLLSYPRPDAKSLRVEEPQYLRPLLPLRQPPRTVPPSPASFSAIKYDAIPGYTRSSHIVPAAFPRTLPTESPLRKEAINGQKIQAKALAKALIDTKLASEKPEAQAANRGMSEVIMWNCVDRYFRTTSRPEGVVAGAMEGITLFVTHAIGSPRQIWEPTLAHLVSLVAANPVSNVRIDEIWSFESVEHGDSALINQGKHRDTSDWQDRTRDIINFLTYYLPEGSHVKSLPTNLDRVSRRDNPRQVVGLGHSFGGVTLALASITHSKLFRSVILVEPIIVPTSYKIGPILHGLLHGTLRKPSTWPSSQAAKEVFRKYPPTNRWDPAVIDVLLEHGLVYRTQGPQSSSLLQPDTPVRSKTHPFDEAVTYCDWLVPYEAWTELEKLDPRVELHWIMSGETNDITGGTEMTQMTVWRRPANSTNIRLPGVGHLMVQESPKTLGAELFRYFEGRLKGPTARL